VLLRSQWDLYPLALSIDIETFFVRNIFCEKHLCICINIMKGVESFATIKLISRYYLLVIGRQWWLWRDGLEVQELAQLENLRSILLLLTWKEKHTRMFSSLTFSYIRCFLLMNFARYQDTCSRNLLKNSILSSCSFDKLATKVYQCFRVNCGCIFIYNGKTWGCGRLTNWPHPHYY